MAQSALDIAETRHGPICVVSLSGRIDSSNASTLSTSLAALFEAGEKAVVIDLASIAYLTSAAFRALLVASAQAEKNGARMVLCGVVGQVRELFEMGGLLKAFNIHASREDACMQLG